MAATDLQLSTPSVNGMVFRGIIWVGALAIAFILLVQAVPPDILSTDLPALASTTAALCILLCLAWSLARARHARVTTVKLCLVVFWLLLISETIFFRLSTTERALGGEFSRGAYDEVAVWGLAFVALAFVSSFHPPHLRQMFSGSYKWASLFALLALASAPLSPVPLYSFAWACKLALVVVLIRLCVIAEYGIDEVVSLLRVTFWGFVVLTVVPIIRVIADPSPAFTELGRLNNDLVSPDGLSQVAATLFLLTLTLYALRRQRWMIPIGIIASVIMILAAGKVGIAGGIISAALFFLFQKRILSSLGIIVGVSILGILVISLTPVSRYLNNYVDSGQASTLTGRTDLWSLAIPEIMQSPIWGHGYVASRFISSQVAGSFPEAGHLHNGFLEVLYNNGLVGFVVIVLMHCSIVRNLLIANKRPRTRDVRLLTVGCVAIYTSLLLNGFFNASFGGHAYCPFMLLIALIIVSEKLRQQSEFLVTTTARSVNYSDAA